MARSLPRRWTHPIATLSGWLIVSRLAARHNQAARHSQVARHSHPVCPLVWLTLLMLPVCLGSVPALAQPGQSLRFVNPMLGNDAQADGSQRSPFRTVTQALQAATANTVILLAPGTYSPDSGEVFPIVLPPGVSLQGDPSTHGRGIVVRGGGAWDSAAVNATIVGSDRSQIIGITVSNPQPQGYAVWAAGSLTAQHNTFTQSASQSVAAASGIVPSLSENLFLDRPRSSASVAALPRPAADRRTVQPTSQPTSQPAGQPIAVIPPAASPAGLSTGLPTGLPASPPTVPPVARPSANSSPAPIAPPAASALPIAVLPAPPAPVPTAPADPATIAVLPPISRTASAPAPANPTSVFIPPIAPPIAIATAPPPAAIAVLPPATIASVRPVDVVEPLTAIEIAVPPPDRPQYSIDFSADGAVPLAAAPAELEFAALQSPTPSNEAAAPNANVLPVPSDEIPVGNTGDLPRIQVAAGGQAQAAWFGDVPAELHYRVVVPTQSDRDRSLVQSLVPSAFMTESQGRAVMQIGAYNQRQSAEQAVEMLSRRGLRARIEPL